ncbi:MAG: hypothetical protein L6R00_19180 [Phycisphaerae bacterium]|nr:hypothetical protein [Phycisphaerae bacterium]
MITIKRKVHFVRRDHGRKTVAAAPRPADSAEPGRIPRISRLMALAIRFDRLIREGKVTDLSELARLAHVTQPRMTQIMNLNHLAPDIQEQLLFLPKVTVGREQIHERILRRLVAIPDFTEQRRYWAASCPTDHLPQGSARSLPSQVVKEL